MELEVTAHYGMRNKHKVGSREPGAARGDGREGYFHLLVFCATQEIPLHLLFLLRGCGCVN